MPLGSDVVRTLWEVFPPDGGFDSVSPKTPPLGFTPAVLFWACSVFYGGDKGNLYGLEMSGVKHLRHSKPPTIWSLRPEEYGRDSQPLCPSLGVSPHGNAAYISILEPAGSLVRDERYPFQDVKRGPYAGALGVLSYLPLSGSNDYLSGKSTRPRCHTAMHLLGTLEPA